MESESRLIPASNNQLFIRSFEAILGLASAALFIHDGEGDGAEDRS
jgi:hypothetical protein